MTGLYDVEIAALDGSPLNLQTLRGNALLIVNVASECGLTPQYVASCGTDALRESVGVPGRTGRDSHLQDASSGSHDVPRILATLVSRRSRTFGHCAGRLS